MNTVLFYLVHPAQFLFTKDTIKALLSSGKTVHLFLKEKDLLEELVKAEGLIPILGSITLLNIII